MLWRSSETPSIEEQILQKRLARKRGEFVEEKRSDPPLLVPLPLPEPIPEMPAAASVNLPPVHFGIEKIIFHSQSDLEKPRTPPKPLTPPRISQISPKDADTYFGSPARERFFERYQVLSKQRLQLHPINLKMKSRFSIGSDRPDLSENCSDPHSPRSKYILECLSGQLNPRPSLLIRKKMSHELRLEHYGMGDEMAMKLSLVLAELPLVTVINISDNNLTDIGLRPLLDQIVTMPKLIELNLSENAIGPQAAEALGRYLSRRPVIPLRRLILSKSNVDDFEGERFVQALIGNGVILELDLSHNLLGHAELLNAVRPNMVTAAEALAKLLQSAECRLEELKLSWNMIRLDSAVQLSRSLSVNQSLTFLDLSYNAIGHFGGLALGDSLLDNRTLRTLLLANNNINASACFVICIGLEMNLALRCVCLDGNPIADQGAQALMNASSIVGSRIAISAIGCNLDIVDDSCWFDQTSPCGNYKLNLLNPFERAIAFKLLHLVANHSSYVLSKSTYEEPPSKKLRKRCQPLRLFQGIVQDKIHYLSPEATQILRNLYHLQECAKDSARAVKLFRKYDRDGSGEIDRQEFCLLVNDLGMDLSPSELENALCQYDVDGDGTIEIEEFSHFVKHQHEEATARIREMTESLTMLIADETGEPIPYIPPRVGVLNLEVVDSFTKKERYRILSASENHNATTIASKIGNLTTLLPYSFHHLKLRFQEALMAYASMYGETGDKMRVLIRILPQMTNSTEARLLLSTIANDDQREMRRLRLGLRSARRPIFGLENGYYFLDLSNHLDRSKLEYSSGDDFTEFAYHGFWKPANRYLLRDVRTYRIQNWEIQVKTIIYRVFEMKGEDISSLSTNILRFNGQSIRVTPQFFTPMPKSGILEFDFSSISRPEADSLVLSDMKCTKILIKMGLISSSKKGKNLKRLEKWPSSQFVNFSQSFEDYDKSSLEHAKMISETSTIFYSQLNQRSSLYMQGLVKEDIRVNYLGLDTLTPQPDSLSGRKIGKKIKQKNRTEAKLTSTESFEGLSDESLTGKNSPKDQFWKDFQCLIASTEVSNEAKSSRLVDLLEDLLGAVLIRCRHLANILQNFQFGRAEKSIGFGSYRVDLIVSLFPRIIDLDNLQLVFSVLSPQEIGCLYSRIGWLNIFNPIKPEGAYEFSLSHWEERQTAKCLLILAMTEPGDNIVGGTFRWQRDMESMPGWTVTIPWLTEDGLPKKGIVSFVYSSDSPDTSMRKILLTMVLSARDHLEELDQLVSEEYWEKWRQYLHPHCAEP